MKSPELLINTSTPSQLGIMKTFYHPNFMTHLPTSHNCHGIKNYLTRPSINNSSTIDFWYWGVARYVWTSISDFCSNGLGFDLKHSVSIVRKYLQEAPKLASNEIMMYNGPSTVAVG